MNPPTPPTLHYLVFELSEDTDGHACFEAVAATRGEQAPAVMAEVAEVLDWAHARFPASHGPLDEGMHWDHDLHSLQEGLFEEAWYTLSLSISGSAAFREAFSEAFQAALS